MAVSFASYTNIILNQGHIASPPSYFAIDSNNLVYFTGDVNALQAFLGPPPDEGEDQIIFTRITLQLEILTSV
jgi:hypothetical protein